MAEFTHRDDLVELVYQQNPRAGLEHASTFVAAFVGAVVDVVRAHGYYRAVPVDVLAALAIEEEE